MNEREVWLVHTNDDLTEGRGRQYVKYVCEAEATAIRLAHHGYVQGSDCPISLGKMIEHEGKWYQPASVVPPSVDDIRVQKAIDEKKKRIDRARAAIDNAEAIGLSDLDIAALRDLIKREAA